jgi:hypothetical protein
MIGRPPKVPLRPLSVEEIDQLTKLSRSTSERAEVVARSKLLLSVGAGSGFTEAARTVGRRDGDAVSRLVARFNAEGLSALLPQRSSGAPVRYGSREKDRILREFQRTPDPETDGTSTWSLTTLKRSLREASDGLPEICTQTIFRTLREAGYTWQNDRTWCETGVVKRKRKEGIVEVVDPQAAVKRG